MISRHRAMTGVSRSLPVMVVARDAVRASTAHWL